MMNQSWEQDATALADKIRSVLRLKMQRERLTDRLLELRVAPLNPGSSPIALVISPDEVIFSAGHGTRFELAALPHSEPEIVRLVEAIANGGLTEKSQRGRVSFELQLDDGTVLTGASSQLSRLGRVGGNRVIHYERYSVHQ